MTTTTQLERIGFMQGRLSPLVEGRIQAFPAEHWQAEFPAAAALGLPKMEWTLDQKSLRENPLLTERGRAEIAELSTRHGVSVPSVTGDCFMQAPFYKRAHERADLLADLVAIIESCAAVGARFIVLPLVDAGRLDTKEQGEDLRDGLAGVESLLRGTGVSIVFESDAGPQELARFIADYPADCFGINYDIGNSASLGYDAREEIDAYAERIGNVHVKDRVRGGTTVPLGTGAADFEAVFSALAQAGYTGNFILQTARADDERHSEVLERYVSMTAELLKRFFAG